MNEGIHLKNPGAANKLLPCWIGPYRITALVGKVAVKIDFPQHYKIHNVFHVSLIKPYKSDGTRHPPKPLAGFEDDDVFPVDALLDKRVTKSGKRTKTQYLVKWKGYGPEENTWVPVANILDPGLIRDYGVYTHRDWVRECSWCDCSVCTVVVVIIIIIKGHSLRRACLQPATNTQSSKPRPPTTNAKSKPHI